MSTAVGQTGTGSGARAGLRGVAVAVAASGACWLAFGPVASALAGDGVVVYARNGGNGSKQRILDYWTHRRLRRAEPLDMTVSRTGEARVRRAQDPKRSFTSGAVPTPDVYPFTTVGKIFGHLPGVGNYECSGTVVDAGNLSTIFTAGHCVAEAGTGRATKLVFIPSYRNHNRPLGTWVFQRIVVTKQWARSKNFNFDFSAVVLSPQAGATIQSVTGGRAIVFNQSREQDYSVYGYPFNKQRGQVMWTCTGHYLRDDPHPVHGPGELPFGIPCDLSSGVSGGGWIVTTNDGSEALNSLSSFGYGHQKILYGPYLGNAAQRTYSTAAVIPTPGP